MAFIAPDWKIETNYPDPEKITNLSLWAWEFLRRNEDYQNAWANYVTKLMSIADRIPQLRPVIDFNVAGPAGKKPNFVQSDLIKFNSLLQDQVEFWDLTPAPCTGELTIKDWNSGLFKRGIQSASKIALQASCGELWGLDTIVNPALSFTQAFDRFQAVSFKNSSLVLTTIKGSTKNIDYDNCITPVFDLRFPVNVLKKQFEQMLKTRSILIEQKKIEPYTSRPDNSQPHFRHYLRVIDAIKAGKKVAEIADLLLPKQDKAGRDRVVRNWKNAGEKLTKIDFRFLPAYIVKK